MATQEVIAGHNFRKPSEERILTNLVERSRRVVPLVHSSERCARAFHAVLCLARSAPLPHTVVQYYSPASPDAMSCFERHSAPWTHALCTLFTH